MRLRNIMGIPLLGVALILVGIAALTAMEGERPDRGGVLSWSTMGNIERLRNGGRPEDFVPFPEVNDWNSLKMTLVRNRCYGACAAYSVEISGDGTAIYNGDVFVAIPGRHVANISEETVRSLFELYHSSDFFWLLDEYAAPISHAPHNVVSIAFDGIEKSVESFAGGLIGMPEIVEELEFAIDEAADVEKWINGTDETVPALIAEGWDFASQRPEFIGLVSNAIRFGSEGLAIDLIEAGAPVNGMQRASVGDEPSALMAAAQTGNTQLVELLLAAGADPHEATEHGMTVLMSAAYPAIPQLVSLVLETGPDVNAAGPFGTTALMHAAAYTPYPGDVAIAIDRPANVRMLLEAGADVHAANDGGHTALTFGRTRVPVARVLLEYGADPNWRRKGGQTVLEGTFNVEMTELLLSEGANPWVASSRPGSENETVLDCMRAISPELESIYDEWARTHPRPEAAE